jgi:hypothetical protein
VAVSIKFRPSIMAGVVAAVLALGACGGGDDSGDAVGTWSHPEEGTIVIEEDGSGSITQSSDSIPLEWEMDEDTVVFTIVFEDGDEASAEAKLEGDELTFRAGDFSGDDPVIFTRD